MQEQTKNPLPWSRRLCSALVCLPWVISINPVFGDVVVLRPTADTALFANFPDNNLGSNPNLVSGANGSGFAGRALMRFDVPSQIPSNAVIQSAVLTLSVVIVPGGGGVDSVFDVHRLLVGWAEGNGTGNTGSPASDGEVTWNNRVHPATPWSASGGAAPNEFSETVSASTPVSGMGNYAFSSTNLVNDVQQWLMNLSTNFGWILISRSEGTPFTARRFGAREDLNNAPTLEVQYSVPGEMEIQAIKAIDGQIRFHFVALAGKPYTVQYRDSLLSGEWLVFTNISPQPAMTNVTILDSHLGHAQRYYRVGAY